MERVKFKFKKPRQSGFVLVTSALTILVLLAFVGMAIDVGYLQFSKRRIQSAADAAAQGAALQLSTGASNDTAKAEGRYDSAKNGFTNGSNGVTVTINIPPLFGKLRGQEFNGGSDCQTKQSHVFHAPL
jgi:uncharacterized membrane protein